MIPKLHIQKGKIEELDKIKKLNKAGGVAQVVEYLPRSMRPQVQTPVPTKILNVSTKKQY
jgi:hypothetical protein